MTKQDYFERYGGSAPENYERFFVPAIGAPLATDLVDAAALRPGERVLDVACGTGVVTRLAKERVGTTGTVAGLDLNPGMLAVARAATPPGVAIEWHQASAEAMGLPDGVFDVVLCQLGLQFSKDRGAAVRETRRVLAPGGRVLVSVVGPMPRVFAVLAEELARHADADAGKFVHLVFSLHDPDVLTQLLRGAGFHDVLVRSYRKTLRLGAPEEFLWQYIQSTPLAAAAKKLDEQGRAGLERDVVAGWRPCVERALTLELDVVEATARAG